MRSWLFLFISPLFAIAVQAKVISKIPLTLVKYQQDIDLEKCASALESSAMGVSCDIPLDYPILENETAFLGPKEVKGVVSDEKIDIYPYELVFTASHLHLVFVGNDFESVREYLQSSDDKLSVLINVSTTWPERYKG